LPEITTMLGYVGDPNSEAAEQPSAPHRWDGRTPPRGALAVFFYVVCPLVFVGLVALAMSGAELRPRLVGGLVAGAFTNGFVVVMWLTRWLPARLARRRQRDG